MRMMNGLVHTTNEGDGSYNLNLTVKTNADVDLDGDGAANFGDSAAADKITLLRS